MFICILFSTTNAQAIDIHKAIQQLFTYRILFQFIEKLNTEIILENHFKLNDNDRKNIQRVEQFLNGHLFGDFPGLEK